MSINLIECLNKAWKYRKNTDEVYIDQFNNLMESAYYAVDQKLRMISEKNHEEYHDECFYFFQKIIAKIIFADDEFLIEEHESYTQFCNHVGIKALSTKEIKELNDSISLEKTKENIKMFSKVRDKIDEKDYETLITGLCSLSLMGDKELDEKEYEIIIEFLNEKDIYPKTWEGLKKEWN